MRDGVPAIFPRSLLDEWLQFLEEEGIKLGKITPRAITEDGLWRWILEHRLVKGPAVSAATAGPAAQDSKQSSPATMPKQSETPGIIKGKACPQCSGDALLKTADRKLYCLKCQHTWKPEKLTHVKRPSKNPSMEEGGQILAAIDSSGKTSKYEDWTIAWLALKRGLRLGEIVSSYAHGSNLHGLRIKDVSATGIQIKGKKGHEDFCPLPETIIARIRQQIGVRTDPEERVFMVGLKEAVSTYDKRFKRYLKLSRVENWQMIHPHSFRHTFGFEAADKTGGNPYQVRDLMRHKSIQMSTVYVESVSDTKKKTILDKMDGVLTAPMTETATTPNISARTVLEKPPLLGAPGAETIASVQPEAGKPLLASMIIPVEPASLKPQDPTTLEKPERFGCSVCNALTFGTLWEARDHVDAENKGKPQDSQWRHYIARKKPGELEAFPSTPDLLPRMKEIVDHAASEIVSQLRPKLVEQEPPSMSKCGDCGKYHSNPVLVDGTGGPCPTQSNNLSYWTGRMG